MTTLILPASVVLRDALACVILGQRGSCRADQSDRCSRPRGRRCRRGWCRSCGRRRTRTRPRRPNSAGCSTSTSDSRPTARFRVPVATTRSSPSPTAQPFSKGIRGQLGGRSAPTVINRAFSLDQFWDGRATTLEEQAKGPIANPIEMGHTHEVCEKCIGGIAGYRKRFKDVFGTEKVTHRPDRPGDRHLRAHRALGQLAVRQVQGRRQERALRKPEARHGYLLLEQRPLRQLPRRRQLHQRQVRQRRHRHGQAHAGPRAVTRSPRRKTTRARSRRRRCARSPTPRRTCTTAA